MNIQFPAIRQGWQCPVCNKVHAPFVVACDCHERRDVRTSTTDYNYLELLDKFFPGNTDDGLKIPRVRITETAKSEYPPSVTSGPYCKICGEPHSGPHYCRDMGCRVGSFAIIP